MPVKFSNHIDLENNIRIQNAPAPIGAGDVVRKQDLDSAVAGLRDKASCRVATQGNLNLASPGANIDGIPMAPNDRVLVKAQTIQAENGIYVWNSSGSPMTRGILSDTSEELEQAITTVEEGTNAGTTWRQTSVNFTLGTNSVIWVPFGVTAPPATTAGTGTVTLATQSEADSGPNSDKAITVSTLRNWSGRKQKVSAFIGDGTATQFDVTHNFNTREIFCVLRRNGANNERIIPDLSMPDANTARLNFAIAPAANGFIVTILT
jgi:hypothetical protein